VGSRFGVWRRYGVEQLHSFSQDRVKPALDWLALTGTKTLPAPDDLVLHEPILHDIER
jgi:hypothetical protein